MMSQTVKAKVIPIAIIIAALSLIVSISLKHVHPKPIMCIFGRAGAFRRATGALY